MAKAFLIKFLPATNTLPTRIKVDYPQIGSKIYSRDSFNPNCESLSIEAQAVERFCLDMGITVYPFTIGQLPNGDYCGVWNL